MWSCSQQQTGVASSAPQVDRRECEWRRHPSAGPTRAGLQKPRSEGRSRPQQPNRLTIEPSTTGDGSSTDRRLAAAQAITIEKSTVASRPRSRTAQTRRGPRRRSRRPGVLACPGSSDLKDRRSRTGTSHPRGVACADHRSPKPCMSDSSRAPQSPRVARRAPGRRGAPARKSRGAVVRRSRVRDHASADQEATTEARRFMDSSSSASEIMGKWTFLRISGLASFHV